MTVCRICLLLVLSFCFSVDAVGQDDPQTNSNSDITKQIPPKTQSEDIQDRNTRVPAAFESTRGDSRPIDPNALRARGGSRRGVASRPLDPSTLRGANQASSNRPMDRNSVRGAYSSNRGMGRLQKTQAKTQTSFESVDDILTQLQSMKVNGDGEALANDWFVVGGSLGDNVNFDVFQGEQYVADRVVEFIKSSNNKGQWRIFHRVQDEDKANELVATVKSDYRKWRQSQTASVSTRPQSSPRGRNSGRSFGVRRSGNC